MKIPSFLAARWPLRKSRSSLFAWFRAISLVVVLSVYGQSSFAQSSGPEHKDPAGFSLQTRLGFQAGDDWEPAIAADRFGHTYALYKHYDVAGTKTCPGCDLHLLLQRSDDGGVTWTRPRPVAPGHVAGGQYDSQIAVDPVDGRTVWASFLQGDNSRIAVVKSMDFGETWSKPKIVSTQPPGLDKDELAVRGDTVVVAYDDNLNTFASVSLDGGEHWASNLVFAGDAQFNLPLAAGSAIDVHGNIFISWDSYDQAHSANGDGPVTLWVTKSSDHGQHWTRTVIDTSGAPPACDNCGFAFYGPQMALAVGGDDTIYLLWNGTTDQTDFAAERIFFARSTDHGRTYSRRTSVSDAPKGAAHAFPALAVGGEPHAVRLGWMDTRTGAWNVFYRASEDGGARLSPTVRVSSFVPGYSYLSQAGFGSPYGDYFSMIVDPQGRAQVAFGEGPSYQGPGNIWVSHSLDH